MWYNVHMDYSNEGQQDTAQVQALKTLALTLLDAHEGVVTVPLRDLKEAYEVGRLGSQVRREMEESLLAAGVGVYPSPLPDTESAFVRLYRRGTKVALLIQNVGRINASGDIFFRNFEKGDLANPEREAIQRIRQIVDELR
jgi:hypothetical protein